MQTTKNLCLVRYKLVVRLLNNIGNRNDRTSLDACFGESKADTSGASLIRLSAVSVHYLRRKSSEYARCRKRRTSHYDSAAG